MKVSELDPDRTDCVTVDWIADRDSLTVRTVAG